MSDRTFGQTQNCKGCRYWSEMMARTDGDHVLAVCLSQGSLMHTWTGGFQTCEAWASGHDGAIDEPGSDPARYDQEASQ